MKLSVVLAVKNEEENIADCLDSVNKIITDLPAQAGEIIVFDEHSDDDTAKIAKKKGAKVFEYKHDKNFHETKQAAIEKAKGEWILLLDADERVSEALAKEIQKVINLPEWKMKQYRINDKRKKRLFERHQEIIERRDGQLGDNKGEISAFFLPRVNMFLGKPLTYAGEYPDGVLRLFKNGYAYLPAKDVHEQMKIKKGKVSWLTEDLQHYDSPTLKRYLERANRYTSITAKKFKEKKLPTNIFYLFYFAFLKPMYEFFMDYFRYKGVLDGMRGFIWSLFSALHYPLAYFKYYSSMYNDESNNNGNKK